MKSLRLLDLVEELRVAQGRPRTAAELSSRLGVSLRTIYRDVVSLQALGIPLRGEAGVGYLLEAGYYLPPVSFDLDELEALHLGLLFVRGRSDRELSAAADRAKRKLGAILVGDRAHEFMQLPLRAAPAAVPLALADQLSAVRRAIRRRELLQFDYTALNGEVTRRLVRPLGLTVFENVWLLTTWCEQRGDFRNFRVDRITDLSTTNATFRHERGKRFNDYLASL